MNKFTLSCIGALALNAGSALASDFSYRTTLDATSARGGLNTASVSLLAPQPGPGARTVASQYFEKSRASTTAITTAGAFSVKERAQKLSYVGDGWFLESLGDGSVLRYRNTKYLDA